MELNVPLPSSSTPKSYPKRFKLVIHTTLFIIDKSGYNLNFHQQRMDEQLWYSQILENYLAIIENFCTYIDSMNRSQKNPSAEWKKPHNCREQAVRSHLYGIGQWQQKPWARRGKTKKQ
jgi:hypothetical protein